jgi:hypothetical protein
MQSFELDKVRDIEGFPIATDEDIIALSDAPYYTACPNPFIEEFIRENGHFYAKLEKLSMDNAYDTFVEMREKQLQKNEESYHKYMYALKLRREAADQIGIQSII